MHMVAEAHSWQATAAIPRRPGNARFPNAFGGWIITDVNVPIFLPGHLMHYVKVMPGDFIFADNDGVQLIPKDLVDEVLLRVETTFEKENDEREKIADDTPIDEVYRVFGVL